MITGLRRTRVWILALLASLLLLVMAPRQASAQVVATSFEELQALMKPADTVYVTDPGGVTIKGKLAGLSASALGFGAMLRFRRSVCRNAMSITSCSNAPIPCGMARSLDWPQELSRPC